MLSSSIHLSLSSGLENELENIRFTADACNSVASGLSLPHHGTSELISHDWCVSICACLRCMATGGPVTGWAVGGATGCWWSHWTSPTGMAGGCHRLWKPNSSSCQIVWAVAYAQGVDMYLLDLLHCLLAQLCSLAQMW